MDGLNSSYCRKCGIWCPLLCITWGDGLNLSIHHLWVTFVLVRWLSLLLVSLC